MKKLVVLLIICAVVLVSYNKAPKKRYFFVGYSSVKNGNGSLVFMTTDYFLQWKSVEDSIRAFTPELEEEDKVVVTGIYEFKSKEELDFFYKDSKVTKKEDE